MYLLNKKYIGISNIGNSCYLSSLLQICIRLPIFNQNIEIESYEEYLQRTKKPSEYIKKSIEVFSKIIYIIRHYIETEQFIQPNPFIIIQLLGKINPIFNSPYEQQDTQEVLTLLLDFINQGHIKNEQSSNVDLTGCNINLMIKISCNHCNYIVNSNDNCLNLSLCVNDQDLINKGLKIETLDDYICDNCKIKGHCNKTTTIYQYPDLLFIYYPCTNIGSNHYLNQQIKMPLYHFDQNKEIVSYELIEYTLKIAVLRLGSHHNNGHYYVNIYDDIHKKWITCDDDNISETEFNNNEYINIRMYVYEKNK